MPKVVTQETTPTGVPGVQEDAAERPSILAIGNRGDRVSKKTERDDENDELRQQIENLQNMLKAKDAIIHTTKIQLENSSKACRQLRMEKDNREEEGHDAVIDEVAQEEMKKKRKKPNQKSNGKKAVRVTRH